MNNIDPFDPQYHDIPLWCVHGFEAHPSIHCLKIKQHPTYGLNVWGYSVYRRSPGFRTLGISVQKFAENKDICFYFDQKQNALDYLSNILEPKLKTKSD